MDVTLHLGTPQKGYSYDFLQTVRGCSDREILDMISEFTLLDLIDYYDLRVPFFRTLADKTAKKIDPPWTDNGKVWEPTLKTPPKLSNQGLWDEYNESLSERIIGPDETTFGVTAATDFSLSDRETLNFYREQLPPRGVQKDPNYRSWVKLFRTKGNTIFSQNQWNDEALVASTVDNDIVLGDKIAFVPPAEFSWTQDVTTRKAKCDFLADALNKLMRIKTRTFKEILEGKIACSETVGFRVEKLGKDSMGYLRKVIQNFLLPYPRDKVLEFVDTQVKYDTKYRYKIYAYKAVFGTEYEYQFPVGQVRVPMPAAAPEPEPIAATMSGCQPGHHIEEHWIRYKTEALDGTTFIGNWQLTGKGCYPDDYVHSGMETATSYCDLMFAPGHMLRRKHTIDQTFEYDVTVEEPPECVPDPDYPYTGAGASKAGSVSQVQSSTADAWTYESRVVNNPIAIHMSDTGATKYAMVVDVISKPSIKIIEVPFHELSPIRVVDRPPMAPNVEIFPYKGKNNNYLINLESATGREDAMPIGIKEEDAEIFEKQFEAQYPSLQNFDNLPLYMSILAGSESELTANTAWMTPENIRNLFSDMLLEYKADDPPAAYEVFRLDTPPTSYFDFANGESIEIPTEGVSSVSLRPAELGKTQPNKKYYYTFRTKDVHGNISNPTPIYEVINVDDSGATYLVVKIYEFPERKRQMKKTMKKFLSISPALDQVELSMPENIFDANGNVTSFLTYDPIYGVGLEDPLIDNNRQYKIRLTSKQTGRKVDLNIRFKSNKITTTEEVDSTLGSCK